MEKTHHLFQQNSTFAILRTGALGWGLWLALSLWLTSEPINWILALLLLAPLVWIPLALQAQHQDYHPAWQQLAAFSLAGSFLLPQGVLAAALAIPWLIWLTNQTFIAIQTWQNQRDLRTWLSPGAWVAGVVAATWAFADRLGWQILGFPPVMGLLTAAHFHYAGILLLMISRWLIVHQKPVVGKCLTLLLLAGITLTAAGITSTHLGGPIWLETAAATVMATGGMAIALGHLRLATQNDTPRISRGLFAIGGLCLLGGMALGLLYGWHRYLQLPWLTIPWMYRVHGTLNALTLGAMLLPGWWVFHRRDRGYAG